MTADVELLPCPWCGEKLSTVRVSEGSTFRWRKVDGCCADGPEVRHDTTADDQAAAEAESRAKAIAAWNDRAKDAEIEALRAEVVELRERDVRWQKIANAARMADMQAEALRAEVAESRRKWSDAESNLAACDSDLREFQQRAERLAEALREDAVCAERYRWLRCGGWEVMQDPKYWRPELRFDAAIDQARGKGVAGER